MHWTYAGHTRPFGCARSTHTHFALDIRWTGTVCAGPWESSEHTVSPTYGQRRPCKSSVSPCEPATCPAPKQDESSTRVQRRTFEPSAPPAAVQHFSRWPSRGQGNNIASPHSMILCREKAMSEPRRDGAALFWPTLSCNIINGHLMDCDGLVAGLTLAWVRPLLDLLYSLLDSRWPRVRAVLDSRWTYSRASYIVTGLTRAISSPRDKTGSAPEAEGKAARERATSVR